MYKNYTLPASNRGRKVCIDLDLPAGAGPFPVVIFLHGFKGFKDWGHFPAVADAFAQAGLACCRCNFSHNGTSPEAPDRFTDLEGFAENNYSREQEDCRLLMDWLLHHEPLQGLINPEAIYLLGHSRGGAMAILFARTEPRIRKLVTWAAVADLESRMALRQHRYWRDKGVIYTYNSRTEQHMPMHYQFYLDYMANKETFDVRAAAASLDIPWLIVHGVRDESVKIDEGRLLKSLNPGAQLMEVKQAGHTFGVSHPFSGELPDAAAKVLKATTDFFTGK